MLAEEAQVKGQEAALESKPALSRVLLQQGHDRLNLAGNFANDSFNSLADEATGVLTMVTVYYDFDKPLFWAATVLEPLDVHQGEFAVNTGDAWIRVVKMNQVWNIVKLLLDKQSVTRTTFAVVGWCWCDEAMPQVAGPM